MDNLLTRAMQSLKNMGKLNEKLVKSFRESDHGVKHVPDIGTIAPGFDNYKLIFSNKPITS